MPIESNIVSHSAAEPVLDLRPEMLAEKLLVSKENEIETLKNQIAIYKKYSEMLEAKTHNQKIKLYSKKEVIT